MTLACNPVDYVLSWLSRLRGTAPAAGSGGPGCLMKRLNSPVQMAKSRSTLGTAGDGMPNDIYEIALESFTEDLKRAFRAAGSPSYRQLQQVSERLRARGGTDKVDVLTSSNTHERLHGRRQQPPPWPWVRSYVTVLRTVAGNNGFSPDSVGSLDEWKQKYDVVLAAYQARRPVTTGRHRKPEQRQNTDQASSRAAGVAPAVSVTHDQADGGDSAHCGEVLRVPAQAGPLQWRHRYRGMSPESMDLYAYQESLAAVVRTYEPQVIPALLQVEPYARAVLTRYCPDASESEITRLVELRLRRQARLRDPRFRLWAVIDEAALRSRQVSAQAMRSQITHLINMAEETNITLQLLNPSGTPGLDDHVAIKESITHFRFPEEHVGDFVFIERPPDGVRLTDRKETAHYSRLMSRLGIRAARAKDIQDHLREIFVEL
jgi:Domain of unknown function (DUF5753)